MSSPVNLPKLGTTMTEATLVEWLVDDGAAVAAGDPICRIETDKVDEELSAPAAGSIRTIAEAGEIYQVGDPLAEIV